MSETAENSSAEKRPVDLSHIAVPPPTPDFDYVQFFGRFCLGLLRLDWWPAEAIACLIHAPTELEIELFDVGEAIQYEFGHEPKNTPTYSALDLDVVRTAMTIGELPSKNEMSRPGDAVPWVLERHKRHPSALSLPPEIEALAAPETEAAAAGSAHPKETDPERNTMARVWHRKSGSLYIKTYSCGSSKADGMLELKQVKKKPTQQAKLLLLLAVRHPQPLLLAEAAGELFPELPFPRDTEGIKSIHKRLQETIRELAAKLHGAKIPEILPLMPPYSEVEKGVTPKLFLRVAKVDLKNELRDLNDHHSRALPVQEEAQRERQGDSFEDEGN